MLKQYIMEDTLKEKTCELFGRHAVFLNNPRLCRFESALGSALLYNNFLYR